MSWKKYMPKASKRKQQKSLVKLIRRRLLIAVSLLAFALLFNFLVSTYVTTRQSNLGLQKIALLEDQDGILVAMLNQETGLRGYIATNNAIFLEPLQIGRPQYLLSVQQLREQAQGTMVSDFSRTQTALVHEEARANDWYSGYAQVQIKRMQSGNLAVARSTSTISVGKGLFDTFRASVVQLQQVSNHDVNNIQLQVESFDQFARIIAFLLSVIAIFILGYTFIKCINVFLRDLNFLKTATNKQGSGDLSARVQELTYKELNQLGQTFNTVAEGLQRRQTLLQLQRDELKTLNAALEEANRVRSEFHSTMSHELRTPLASIIGFSQILLDDTEKADLNQRQRDNLERILKNGKHLLVLINDVLDLSKIEAGRMVVNYSQVDVRDLLTSVVEETQSIAIAQHLVLRAEVAEGIGSLESDPLKLRQILLNLVSNALKFTDQGEVTVMATRAVSSSTGVDQLVLAVKDSGIGIPLDIQEHIFEAFYQVDGTYTRKIGGTGLGLSIVNQLTTLLGGTIAVKSTAGQGSTFMLTLPIKAVQRPVEQEIPRLHQAPQPEVSAIPPSSNQHALAIPDEVLAVSAPGEATDGHDLLILAVDDNPDVLALIKAALKDMPYTVVGVQDSSKVMALVQVMHPCAITLDVLMPDLNGWQILHQLKDNPATASIPVVMITVLSEQATGYVLGANDYLIKPFKSDALLSILHSLVTEKQISSQSDTRETQPV